MKKLLLNIYFRYGLILFTGLSLGWLFFHNGTHTPEAVHQHGDIDHPETWTCSMHPQIKMDKPGKCPICAMDLIPLNKMAGDTSANPDAVHFTQEAIALANIRTSIVTSHKPEKEIRLFGKVQVDERLMQSMTASISGRIEKLLVNFTGEFVHKGQTLALIYSPELVTAQQELLEALKTKNQQPEFYQAAREKLRLWRLTENQINNIEKTGKVKTEFEVLSGTSGIVTSKQVKTGDYISQGSVLFNITNLSQLWVLFDAYESDLPFLKVGDEVQFNIQAVPGKTFKARIKFINPVIDPVTRTTSVRIEIGNAHGELKPEMFVEGRVNARLNEYKDYLVIPRSAVLWTGKRSVVYIKDTEHNEPSFSMREIELGPELGNSFVVLDGLFDGDEIVTEGAFSIDASAQLQGKASMMNNNLKNE